MCALQAVHGTSSIRHNKGYASAQCVNDGMTLINVNVLRRARNIKQLRKWRKTLIWWMSRGYDGLQLHSKLVSGCRFVASRSSGGITLLQRNMTYVSGYLRTYIYESDCVGVEASRVIWLFRRGTRKWRARWLQTRLWWAGGTASTAWASRCWETKMTLHPSKPGEEETDEGWLSRGAICFRLHVPLGGAMVFSMSKSVIH